MKPKLLRCARGVLFFLVLILGISAFAGGGFVDLTTGWWYVLASEAPRIDLDVAKLLIAAAILAAAIAILHVACRWRFGISGWTLRSSFGVPLLAAIVLVAGLASAGIYLEIDWLRHAPRPLATRSQEVRAQRSAQNSLRNMAFGFSEYKKGNGTFPPGYSTDRWGQPLHGWQFHILPYLEYDNIYRLAKRELPWDHASNLEVYSVPINEFTSPFYGTQHDGRYGLTHYAGNRHLLSGGQGRVLEDFAQGMANSILAGEVTTGFPPWGYPLNFRDPAKGIRNSADAFAGPWSYGITHFVMADGSIRSFTPDVSPEVLRAMASPSGGRR